MFVFVCLGFDREGLRAARGIRSRIRRMHACIVGPLGLEYAKGRLRERREKACGMFLEEWVS